MDLGVVGVGAMGVNHARIYSELKEVKNLYIYDIDQNKTKEIAELYDANICSSYDELLKSVEAVNVCVPTHFHYGFAKKSIEKNIPTLIEKPLCNNHFEAQKIMEIIPKGLIVGVGHIERFNPIIPKILNIVKNPLYVEINRHNPDSARIKDSTVIEDLMIHDIDIVFNNLFPEKYEKINNMGNADIASCQVKFKNSTVHISASRKASKKIRRIYIEEEERTIEADLMNQEIYVFRKPTNLQSDSRQYLQENVIEKILINKLEPLKTELNKFIECIKNSSNFPVTPEQAAYNLQICDIIKEDLNLSI
ncbi:putative dehydrogenase [Methanomicrobium sp. W14]|uniref:Gfo/Idh/MocA family protein n=1 Tax=Methanomicrobium sp. W14 TaxID=2817839 RepID=UPI001AEABE11|nr:Gfo/Idh/MocA family oxidoreductase [Methanomicrobium sp. W14]MBP2134352.1 putative dehydrogenase [Methanomicrobium sp. W14]